MGSRTYLILTTMVILGKVTEGLPLIYIIKLI